LLPRKEKKIENEKNSSSAPLRSDFSHYRTNQFGKGTSRKGQKRSSDHVRRPQGQRLGGLRQYRLQDTQH
jgi:hypothetical protein